MRSDVAAEGIFIYSEIKTGNLIPKQKNLVRRFQKLKKKSMDYASSFSELRLESNYDYPRNDIGVASLFYDLHRGFIRYVMEPDGYQAVEKFSLPFKTDI